MSERLIARVAGVLEDLHVPFGLVGASALAAYGVARSTFDVDLFTLATEVLKAEAWQRLGTDPAIRIDVRHGDAGDPLAGVVRIAAAGERDVDVIVGRAGWQGEALTRARRIEVFGDTLPVVSPADLVLFKLYAGGSQDCWDIEQLLATVGRDQLVAEVGARVATLPAAARRLWESMVNRPGGSPR